MGNLQDGIHQMPVPVVIFDTPDQLHIHLENIHRQGREHVQGRIAGSEIIHLQTESPFTQLSQYIHNIRGILHIGRLCDFQVKIIRRQAGFGKNSVTIFNGKVTIKDYTRQIVRGNSWLHFRGGVEFGGYYGSRTMDTSPSGSDSYFVFESPVTYDRPAIDTVNGFPVVLHNYTVFDMRVDYAFTSGYWNNSGKVELNGHPQMITKWTGTGTISSTNGTVSLEYNPPAGLVCTNSNKFVGFAGLNMVGGGTVVMKGVSTSEGELVATNGVMELAEGASWANCSRVSVSGAGQIRVGRSAALPSRYTVYTLENEGARLFLADDVSLETYELRIDGKKQGPGIYGARAARSEWFDASGGGSIRVVSAGTQIIFK